MENEESGQLQEKLIFEQYSVPKALSAMVLPTIISQIIFVIYNMADTWFVGLSNNPDAVAAVSLCLPIYTILSAISNLFGIGGAGIVSRALGGSNPKKAHNGFVLSICSSAIIAAVYSLLLLFFARPLLYMIGADSGDIDLAVSYVFWTVSIGGVPTILSSTFAHLIRAYGYPKQASFGIILGAVLNIALDPLFMFVILPDGNEVMGAAIATALANSISFVYFLLFTLKQPTKFAGSFALKFIEKKKEIMRELMRGGLPGFCMVALAMLSNCFLNSMLSGLGTEAVAGIGVVRKIDQLSYAVNQGITQGMLPLVAYCYSSGRYSRMKKTIALATIVTELFSLLCMIMSLLLAPQLVSIFIREPVTVAWGADFLRILCIAFPVFSLTFVAIAVFQAVGRGTEPLILSIINKGSLDIVLLFLINSMYGTENILWATPISQSIALIFAIVLLVPFLKKQEDKVSVV